MIRRIFTIGFLALGLGCFTLFVSRADIIEYFAGGEEGRLILFGGGGDGVFNDGPAQTGIGVAGANITVNTDVKSVYEFSSFTLSGADTMTVTGSLPLIIRVTGTTSIAGTLQSEGATGGAAAAAAPTGTGGTPGAGGGRGGIGGERLPVNANATTGSSRGTTSFGGGFLANVFSGIPDTQYSGGGGCNGFDAAFPATAGTHPSDAAVGGAAGACTISSASTADTFEAAFSSTSFPGGAGGGGGGTQSTAANGINGAGGGGGGGAIHISSMGNLSITGLIRVRGGVGGTPNTGGGGDYGAAGGGGSGGSIWAQTAGTLSGAGTLNVSGGVGGTDGASIGGNGSRGVIRLDAGTYSFTGTFTPKGAVDRTFTVLPVKTTFTLSGGPACGSTSRPSPTDLPTFLFWVFAFGVFWTLTKRRV